MLTDSGFSVGAPEGKRFLIRSRMLSDAELGEFGIEPRFAVGAGAGARVQVP